MKLFDNGVFFVLLSIMVLMVLIGGIGLWYESQAKTIRLRYAILPLLHKQQQISTIPNESLNETTGYSLLDRLPHLSLKNIEWEDVRQDSYYLDGKVLLGYSRSGALITDNSFMVHFEDENELKRLGWIEALEFGSGGIDGGSWGYKKGKTGKRQVLVLSWKNSSLQSTLSGYMGVRCPCSIKLKVFMSDKF